MMYLAATVVVVVLGAYALETMAYLAKWSWYYRLGPALHRETWQTSVTVDEALDALDLARHNVRLSSRRAGDAVLLRFRWMEVSVWPRVILRVAPSPMGAVLVYEVRPFISMTLVVLLMFLGMVAIPVQWFWSFAIAMIVVIGGSYAIGWRLELRKLNRLHMLIANLSAIGVQACPSCGYDRYGLSPDAMCPECGAVVVAQ